MQNKQPQCTCDIGDATSDIGHFAKCPLAKAKNKEQICQECGNPQCIAKWIPYADEPPRENKEQELEKEFDKVFSHSKFCRESKVGTPCNCDYDGLKFYLYEKIKQTRTEATRQERERILGLIEKRKCTCTMDEPSNSIDSLLCDCGLFDLKNEIEK